MKTLTNAAGTQREREKSSHPYSQNNSVWERCHVDASLKPNWFVKSSEMRRLALITIVIWGCIYPSIENLFRWILPHTRRPSGNVLTRIYIQNGPLSEVILSFKGTGWKAEMWLPTQFCPVNSSPWMSIWRGKGSLRKRGEDQRNNDLDWNMTGNKSGVS